MNKNQAISSIFCVYYITGHYIHNGRNIPRAQLPNDRMLARDDIRKYGYVLNSIMFAHIIKR